MSQSMWMQKAAQFQQALGRVGAQPLDVHSFTNKRFTINFRVPLDELQRLLPDEIRAEEVGTSGYGMLGMCACDFWVPRIGMLRIPTVRNNDMLCRISTTLTQGGKSLRAFYTVHSVSSSRLLGALGQRYSHFRKRRARFERIDDATTYALQSRSDQPLSCGKISARMDRIAYAAPAGSLYADSFAARDFLFQLDGSCGYQWDTRRLSFQVIEYPEWDISFCHDVSYELPLIDALVREFDLHIELDSTVYMHDTPQVWCATRLYPSDRSDLWRPSDPRRASEPQRRPPVAAHRGAAS
jgi:hypothetical protein